MAKFEVHIPAVEPGGFNLTLKVGADNWMAALKAGMQKLGEQGAISQNVMVDVQEDNSIHVTEALSGRVFRIRELSEDEAARAQVKRPSQIIPPRRKESKTLPPFQSSKTEPPFQSSKTDPGTPSPDAPSTQSAKTLVGAPAFDPNAVTAPPPPAQAVTQPPASSDSGLRKRADTRPPRSSPRMEVADVEELVQPVKPVVGNIGRARTAPSATKGRVSTEEMLADIFLRVVELDRLGTVEEAMNFVLDLAMEKVPCESGSVLRADGATGDLTFLAARGPKAQAVLRSDLVIPAGAGIAGFCAAEGVSLAVSDVEKDPRFYSGVGEKVDYETKSLLCAPMMTHGRSFGCMQLLNRKGGPQFQEHEVGVLAYLAHQAALFMNAKLLE